ncbi:hypothetical protein C8J36_110136 [Rhizobium sp. PP-F2F-G48]|nr:hypothetical protein C8J36_110136 [Rhizobium sp. PP-F2F-G48]
MNDRMCRLRVGTPTNFKFNSWKLKRLRLKIFVEMLSFRV